MGIEDLGHCDLGGGNICWEEASLGLAEPAVQSIQILVSGAPLSGTCGNCLTSRFLFIKKREQQRRDGSLDPLPGLWLLTLRGQNKDKVDGAVARAN